VRTEVTHSEPQAQLTIADKNRAFAVALLDKYRPGGKAESGKQKAELKQGFGVMS
jgi:hypothetical protein